MGIIGRDMAEIESMNMDAMLQENDAIADTVPGNNKPQSTEPGIHDLD